MGAYPGDDLCPSEFTEDTAVSEINYQLVVRKGPKPGQVFPLASPSISLGRDPMSDITLSDPEVSRYHAQMVQTETGYQVQDMGSTNGTYVDEQRLTSDPVSLTPGQSIMLGSGVILDYEMVTEDEDDMVTVVDASLPPSTTARIAGAVPTEPTESPDLPPLPEFDDDYIAPSSASYAAYEPPPQQPPPPLVPSGDDDEKRRRNTIITVVAILLICCCCAVVLSGYFYWGDLLLDWLSEQGFLNF
jgi:pSer/pThr/pTyr-binding forkhead associated (FHA) protein